MADTTSGEPDFATSIAAVIKEESAGGAACGWRSCTGCHETNEGAETGYYPYSKIFGCYVGSGCSECGGLGVVWEYYSKRDLDEMQRETTRPLTNELLAAALTRLASAEAFTMPRGINRPADDELVARMDFARAILAGSETVWPAEADTALKATLKYLRGQAPDVVSGSQRNGDLRSRIKWVLLGCGGPLRSDVDGPKPLVTPEWAAKMAEREGDTDPTTGRPEPADFTFHARAAEEWPALKKALWRVVVGAEINARYIGAFDFTEKLYQAALVATPPAEPVVEADAVREALLDAKAKLRMAFRKALSELPEIAPTEIKSVLSSVHMREEFINEGKRLQLEHGTDAVAPRVEQECGAGAWSFMRSGVLTALATKPAVKDDETVVEALLSWVCEDVLPAYGVSGEIARNDPELAESCRAALAAKDGRS